MGRKKKTAETPASGVVLSPPPVKNRSISKSFADADVERPLTPEDYEKIQQDMVTVNRQRADLAAELEERMSLVKETRKKLGSLSGAIEKKLFTIESGRITEERRCLRVRDLDTMLISLLDPETGEMFRQETVPDCMRQGFLDFRPDPDEDCHVCKHIICRLPVDEYSEGCQNFLDCHDCPNFKCGYMDPEEPGRCGFGKHLTDEDEDEAHGYPEERDCDSDCFFCGDRKCGCVDFDLSLCPLDNTGGKDDCFRCEHFKCDDPHSCTAEMKKEQISTQADEAGADDDEAAGADAEVA